RCHALFRLCVCRSRSSSIVRRTPPVGKTLRASRPAARARAMLLERKQVAVTGATGFLGRYIVDTLLHRGARVVGVVRNPDRVPELRERGVELRRADLAARDDLV